jgi:hypothetical protein
VHNQRHQQQPESPNAVDASQNHIQHHYHRHCHHQLMTLHYHRKNRRLMVRRLASALLHNHKALALAIQSYQVLLVEVEVHSCHCYRMDKHPVQLAGHSLEVEVEVEVQQLNFRPLLDFHSGLEKHHGDANDVVHSFQKELQDAWDSC